MSARCPSVLVAWTGPRRNNGIVLTLTRVCPKRLRTQVQHDIVLGAATPDNFCEDSVFEKELAYFIAHQKDLVAKYDGKTLVLRENELVGVYDNPLQAYLEAQKQFEPGTFMIQPCAPGPEAYTVTIHA